MPEDKLDVNIFLNTSDNGTILDVRSPSEFAKGHIPDAKNFPLFSDEERAEVGLLYKEKGQFDAVLRGLDIVGPKLRGLVLEAKKHNSKEFHVHCWRGGMRSEYMGKLLSLAGYSISTLPGGYKAYKRSQLELFAQKFSYIVLTGYTGSGKTRYLKMLRDSGEQVVDLEGLANHQGSSFGNQKSTFQPTTEQFHNDLYEVMRNFDPQKQVWIEDESFSIGRVHLPAALYRIKNLSPHLIIEVDKKERIQNLLEEYGSIDISKLQLAVEGIKRKLGGDRYQLVLEMLKQNNGKGAAGEILQYYDKRYKEAVDRKKSLVIDVVDTDKLSEEEVIQKLLHATHVD
ncbi:MAG: tRNA 2-selenouridine(34) synthase MnmH [Flavobacteriales bacterium]|nr:tRNA 2-selenouridine(34) synthase MnmH [Flavobacteriales bacterium]MBT3964580.1 tRNA 2-selenouridine(34) synthase MnmH [Flavobacteriales bacterium]MBT4704606.1 tRNA 2-selenouridine(34) synthase MnmH [Flavobacteriales bacterium]MBT4930779.1 tRNA 2-selenouridine(34) synthase MnmH [Flavobacteriales bacterium]MBT5976548.1 tRNA 2-selenouridine(34) synthase MnmH [Flavobacteriales bacterium]